jgi:hypothetical protein
LECAVVEKVEPYFVISHMLRFIAQTAVTPTAFYNGHPCMVVSGRRKHLASGWLKFVSSSRACSALEAGAMTGRHSDVLALITGAPLRPQPVQSRGLWFSYDYKCAKTLTSGEVLGYPFARCRLS